MIIDIILISKEIMADSKQSTPTLREIIALSLILVAVLYVFTLPCFYAARITSKCTGKRRRVGGSKTNKFIKYLIN